VKAYSVTNQDGQLALTTIPRRELLEKDVHIDLLFCGVCHSDWSLMHNEWGVSKYPMVPGHEMVGKVTKVGSGVTKFKVGDLAGVGCIVDSDRTCDECKAGLEQFCAKKTISLSSPDKHFEGGYTFGGFSESVVVDENYVLRIPANLDLAATAPLLCAGITVYSPLRHWNVKAGQNVAINGLGGLGHLGVKFAKAFGAKVFVLTRSADKADDCRSLGADGVVISTDANQMKAHYGFFDFILDTVSANHEMDDLFKLLRRDGTVCLLGAPPKPLENPVKIRMPFLSFRKSFATSNIGSIAETQEMLDFCAKHNLTANVEVVPVEKINEAFQRMVKNDVKYRFTVDLAGLKKAQI